MRVQPLELPEVLHITPETHDDSRGRFLELWHGPRYADAGLGDDFRQDNLSFSTRGVLRGLHVQYPQGQAKLVSVLAGEVFDVAVDVRVGSPTFGRWVGVTLSADPLTQLYIPSGFAHGFAVLSDRAIVSYKCSDNYHPDSETAIRWDDPDLAIDWPVSEPLVSDKDAGAPRLGDVPRSDLPPFASGSEG